MSAYNSAAVAAAAAPVNSQAHSNLPVNKFARASRWRQFSRRARWVALTLILGFGVIQILPPRAVWKGSRAFQKTSDGRPLVIAHRGGRALFPENTLQAFAGAVRLGVDALEMDLRLTRDGVLVTCHDADISRTSDGVGVVRDHTLAELQSLNFGFHFTNRAGAAPYRAHPARIATLEELFQQFTNTLMVLELKDHETDGQEAAEKLARLIAKYGRESTVLVASFDEASLDAFRRATGGRVATSLSTTRARRFVIFNLIRLDWFGPVGDAALQVPLTRSGFALDRPGLIRAAHARNWAVHYWTINDAEEMRRLIALGADGIITDRPDLARQIAVPAGKPEPAASPAR